MAQMADMISPRRHQHVEDWCHRPSSTPAAHGCWASQASARSVRAGETSKETNEQEICFAAGAQPTTAMYEVTAQFE